MNSKIILKTCSPNSNRGSPLDSLYYIRSHKKHRTGHAKIPGSIPDPSFYRDNIFFVFEFNLEKKKKIKHCKTRSIGHNLEHNK